MRTRSSSRHDDISKSSDPRLWPLDGQEFNLPVGIVHFLKGASALTAFFHDGIISDKMTSTACFDHQSPFCRNHAV